jgi:hypothetical protein
MLLFRSKNPLVYPGDRFPGFDPSHPAANGCFFSGIAVSGQKNVINLISGSIGSAIVAVNSTPLDGAIGPTILPNTAAGTTGGLSYSIASPATLPFTIAVIGRAPASVPASIQIFLTTTGTTNLQALTLMSTTGVLRATVNNAAKLSALVPAAGRPFFAACSVTRSVAGSVLFVLAQLDTGQITTDSVNNNSTIIAGTGLRVGNSFSQLNSFTGLIAAAMMSNAALTLNQLITWAADPWSYWYPPTVENLIGKSLLTFTAFPVTYQSNQRIIMTG